LAFVENTEKHSAPEGFASQFVSKAKLSDSVYVQAMPTSN